MTSRQQKRAVARSTSKAEDSQHIYLIVPEAFSDCMGEDWVVQTPTETSIFDFKDVMLHTLRKCPVQNAEDSERALEIIKTIKGTENGFIELRRADYDWMDSQFKTHAHKLWNPPDAAHLRKVLADSLTTTKPTE